MRYLPFRDQSINCVSCISALEHIPGSGDTEAASEIGRILRMNGNCVVSIPLASNMESYSKQHWTGEIPPLAQSLFCSSLPAILDKLQIDRTSSYFERFFSLEDVHRRIVLRSKCVKWDYFTLKSGQMTKILHQRIIPQGLLAPLEYLIARFLRTGKRTANADAIIIKLRKSTR